MPDQFDRWRAALAGQKLDMGEKGNPPSGFFRRHVKGKWEAVEIWRDPDDGMLLCARNMIGTGVNMTPDQIDEMMGTSEIYPVPHEIYVRVVDHGDDWPPEFTTRLTVKEVQAGTAMTPELGRAKSGTGLAAPIQDWATHVSHYRVAIERVATVEEAFACFEVYDIDGLPRADRTRMETMLETITHRFAERERATEPARATIGHNQPPEAIEATTAAPQTLEAGLSTHKAAGQTPDEKLAGEQTALAMGCKAWLTEIGGKPRNKAEADRMADYATSFGTIRKSAEDQHKVEKAPILELGKEIDAKWFRIRDNAKGARSRCLELADHWMAAENARLKAEADTANAEAAALAAKHAKTFDAPVTPPTPVEADRVTGVGNLRTVSQRARDIWIVTDPAALCAYLCDLENPPAELLEVLGKIANRLGASIKAGIIKDIPGIGQETKRSAA